MLTAAESRLAVCLTLTRAISGTRTVEEIYTIALEALADGLGVTRASILLFDPDGVMRFKAHRHLSGTCRRAIEGHAPWPPGSPEPEPIVVADVLQEPSLAPHLPTIKAEGIAAMAFIPLVSFGRVIGTFLLCFEAPHVPGTDEMQLAGLIASQVAFAIERTRAEEQARRGEERLRFALDAASMEKEAELSRLAAAEEANRLKDEFLATLSHELRTPLQAILGWVQILQAVGPSQERIRQAIDIIGRNAQFQAQLIEDILDVSRIISGKLEIERLPVFLQRVVETVASSVLPAAQAKNIDLVKVVADDLPPIEGDPQRLHQVIGNVLSNAIKFTPEGGRVEILCAVQGDAISIEVRDSGIGIAPEFLPYVFDRFRQAKSDSTRQHGGLGLGLAIARYLLERHGGEIRAQSEGAGCGTTVIMRLPIRSDTGAGVYPRTVSTVTPTRVLEPAVEQPMDGSTAVVVDDQRDSVAVRSGYLTDEIRHVVCPARPRDIGLSDHADASPAVVDDGHAPNLESLHERQHLAQLRVDRYRHDWL